MKVRTNSLSAWLGLGSLLLVGPWPAGCGEEPSRTAKVSQTRTAQSTKENEAAAEARINDLLTKYDAIKPRINRLDFTRRYSVDLQDALVRPDSRPVLLYGQIVDVERHRSGLRLLATVPLSAAEPKLTLVLETDQDVGKRVLRGSRDIFTGFALIARIEKIGRSRGWEPSEDDGDSSWAPVLEITAWGTLLDLAPSGVKGTLDQ